MHFIEAKGLVSPNNTMNIYRGCTHGCIYCDSRSHCYNMKNEFEDIAVKENTLELLEQTLKGKRKRCMIGTGAMSDPYMPLEIGLQYVRNSLKLISKYEFGFSVITKSDLILRDLDLLKEINDKAKCVVQITLTTFDDELCKILEPNVSVTSQRVNVLRQLRDLGIPTIVWICPILPFINDTEENLNGIIDYCIEAKVYGVICFGIGMTLREGSREYFYKQLDKHFPNLKEKYIETYGNAYNIPCQNSKKLYSLLERRCKENGIICNHEEVFEYISSFEEKNSNKQLSFFENGSN